MHIHRFSFGSSAKLLLRRSQRDGERVSKVTLANLFWWPDADVEELRKSLAFMRGCRGPEKELARQQIIEFVVARLPSLEKYWQFVSGLESLPGRRQRKTVKKAKRVTRAELARRRQIYLKSLENGENYEHL